jgi:hypothetical protein
LAKNSELKQLKLIESLQKERNQLNIVLIKQKNFSKIKLYKVSQELNKEITELTENSDKIKRRETNHTLMSEQRHLLVHQQKTSLKRQLSKLDVEFNSLKQKFEKELNEKQMREHELQQKMKNERNLNSAKQSNVDKLLEELEDKDTELRTLHMITEKTSKMHTINDGKIQREVNFLKKNLLQERNFKLEAFQKVDELQSHLYDIEDEMTTLTTVRPQSSYTKSKNLRLSSAGRFVSPFPRLNGNGLSNDLLNNDLVNASKSNQNLTRPKTGITKFKSAELKEQQSTERAELFYHETISKLRENNTKTAKS